MVIIMKKADIITGTSLILLSVYVLATAWGMELWTTGADSAPGPGFVSFIAGIVLLLLSAVLVVNALRQSVPATEKPVISLHGLMQLGIVAGSALVASILSQWTGFVIAMGLMGAFLTTMLAEKKNVKVTALVGVILPAVLYLIFKVGLDVMLPVGFLGI